jgi:hypothetical protein
LKSRSSSSREAIPTSPNAVPNAVRQGKQNVSATAAVTATETIAIAIAIEIAATVPHLHARCSRQCALIVARKLQYPSSPAKVDRYIAVIATAK